MAYVDAEIKIEMSLTEAFCILAALADYSASGEGGEVADELFEDIGTQLGILEESDED
jgi:hypothetical protein